MRVQAMCVHIMNIDLIISHNDKKLIINIIHKYSSDQ